MSETNTKTVVFVGIDSWNRPIFKHTENEFYGDTDNLFSYGASEQEVLDKISEINLTYFGSSFDCEPMGTTNKNIKIKRVRETK